MWSLAAVVLALAGCASSAYNGVGSAGETDPPAGTVLDEPRIDGLPSAIAVTGEPSDGPWTQPDAAVAAVDPSQGLSPIEAAYLALSSNPGLKRARADLGIERVELRQAAVLPDPELAAGVGSPVAGAGPDDRLAWSLGLSWEVTGSVGRGARRDVARRTGDSVRLDVAWQEWGVFQATRGAASDVAALSDQLRQLTEWSEALAERVDRLEDDSGLGWVQRRETDDARRQLADVRSREALVQADLQDARRRLNALVGVTSETELPITEAEAAPALPPRDALLDQLAEHRFDLLALSSQVDASAAGVREAETARFPPITVGVGADSDTTGLLVSMLTVSLPLSVGGQRAVVLDRALLDQSRTTDESATRTREAIAEVVRLYATCLSWREREALAESQVELASRLAEERQADVEAGLATWPEAERLRDDQWEAALELADIRRQSLRATIELETASGQLFTPVVATHD